MSKKKAHFDWYVDKLTPGSGSYDIFLDLKLGYVREKLMTIWGAVFFQIVLESLLKQIGYREWKSELVPDLNSAKCLIFRGSRSIHFYLKYSMDKVGKKYGCSQTDQNNLLNSLERKKFLKIRHTDNPLEKWIWVDFLYLQSKQRWRVFLGMNEDGPPDEVEEIVEEKKQKAQAEVCSIKTRVRKRDKYQCVDCGMSQQAHLLKYDSKLQVHRLMPGSLYSLEGCVTVCRECHKARHKTLREMTK